MSDTPLDLRSLEEQRTPFGPVYQQSGGKFLVLCLEGEERSFDPRRGFAEPFNTLAEAAAFVRGVERAYGAQDKHLIVAGKDDWFDGQEAIGAGAERQDEKDALPAIFIVADDARPDVPPLPMRAYRSGYGIAVCAVNDHGEDMGEAYLDYHDNRLQAIAYLPGVDEPHQVTLLVADVDAARQKLFEQKETPP